MNKRAVALMITDTHATSNNIWLQESIWNQFFEKAEELGVSTLLHGGDMVHARKSQPLEVLKHLSWIKESVIDNGFELIGLSGNHDLVNQEDVFSYPTLLDDDDFQIIDQSYQYKVNDNLSIWFLAYFPEKGSYKDRIEKIKMNMDMGKKNILVSHISVNGGLAHKNATTNKEVPADLFDDFDKVLLGHFHNRNRVDYDNVDIHYVGSAFANNYGEDNEKGFTIIYDDGSIEFVNAKFPKYETIQADISEIDGKWMKQTKNHIQDSGNNVRLIVTGDESELKKLKPAKFSEIGIKQLKKNSDNIAIRDESNKVVFVSLDKETVIKEYKKFAVEIEIEDVEFGVEYLSV